MNQQSGHLSDLQIQECAATVPGGGPGEVEAHLSQCESCLGRLLEWQRTQLRIGETDAMRPKPYADCPEESTLQEVAAEMASAETSTRVLQHASQCDHCGPLLSQYLEDFSDELSPEMEALIEQLPFSQPQWQRQKAKEIVSSSTSKWKRLWNRTAERISASKVRATAGAMAVLAGIGIVIEPAIMSWWQIRDIEKQMILAYQSQPSEARFPGAPPMHLQKSVTPMSSEEQDSDPALIKATQLCPPQGKADPRACQYKGRLLLLHDPKNWEPAADAFRRAQGLGLNTASLKIDVGIADLLHAKNSDTYKYDSAIRELKAVLNDKTLSEDDRKNALFNLGLAYELSGAHDPALSAWNEYLNVDSSGGWADEARIHLDKLRSKPQ